MTQAQATIAAAASRAISSVVIGFKFTYRGAQFDDQRP
jgi:hypothetical protein